METKNVGNNVEATKSKKTESVTLSISDVSVPLNSAIDGLYISRNLSIKLEQKHALILSRVLGGLSAKGEVTDSGRPVRSTHQAIVWILEQIEKHDSNQQI